jgi:uncharacterized protein YecA (UPF0149 family)
MKKINLNKAITDLDGKDIEGSNLGKLVAQMLASATKGDALKFMSWALKLHAGESLELDPSDVETLKNFIKDHDQLTILSKAQILECFA